MEPEVEKRGPGRPPGKNKVLDTVLAEEPAKKESKPVVLAQPENLTPDERAIYGRVMQESDEWRTISEEESFDFSLARDPFLPPEPAQKLEKEKRFKFRWVTATPARLEEIKNKRRPLKWWIVNSTQPVAGAFDKYLDPNTGAVRREDQMLVFKSWEEFQQERRYKDSLASGADRSRNLEARHGERIKDGIDIAAGKRKGTEDKSLRQEIKGSDIQFRGEEEMDIAMGRSTPLVSESDLSVE